MAQKEMLQEKMLREKALAIRTSVVRMIHGAGSGHVGGSLGMADIFTALYFSVLSHRPKQPDWPERDRLILSNGHICPVWYATLAEAGYLPREELMTLRKLGSRLQGHPANKELPLVEISTGSLGQGVSAAVGLALGTRMDGRSQRVYCCMGDGEMQEGSVWEALMAAGHYRLTNLTAFVDRNMVQQNGKTEEIIGLEPLRKKLEAFRWTVFEADGHDFEQILDAFERAKRNTEGPSFIIFSTVMAKGVKFMEHDFKWHGTPPDDGVAKRALDALGGGAR